MTSLLDRITRAALGSALCSAAFAAPSDPSALQPAFDLSAPSPAALTQAAEDGTVWARGTAWKAHFTDSAVEYRAFGAGRQAPERAAFSLDSVSVGPRSIALDANVPPVLEGQRVTYDRGALSEVYDIEQRADSTDNDVFAATIDPITGAFSESHVSLGASIFLDAHLAMASTFGSGGAAPSRSFATWMRQPSATDFDVIGALYSQP
jgi:hypothetical protein